MTEEQRQRAIRLRLARSDENRPAAVLPTGFAALDDATGVGGLPRGRMVELFGASSSGKTTLALQIVAHVQSQGATAAWIDAEHAFDATYAGSLGVMVQAMPLAQPDSAEQAIAIACQLAASGAVDLLVVDSAAALVPQLELDAALGEGSSGLYGRVLASGLRRLSQAIAKNDTVVVFLNQTRSRMQSSGGAGETSAGGPPLKLYAALRIALEAPEADRVGFRVLKNKAAAPFREGILRRRHGGEFTKSP